MAAKCNGCLELGCGMAEKRRSFEESGCFVAAESSGFEVTRLQRAGIWCGCREPGFGVAAESHGFKGMCMWRAGIFCDI